MRFSCNPVLLYVILSVACSFMGVERRPGSNYQDERSEEVMNEYTGNNHRGIGANPNVDKRALLAA